METFDAYILEPNILTTSKIRITYSNILLQHSLPSVLTLNFLKVLNHNCTSDHLRAFKICRGLGWPCYLLNSLFVERREFSFIFVCIYLFGKETDSPSLLIVHSPVPVMVPAQLHSRNTGMLGVSCMWLRHNHQDQHHSIPRPVLAGS